MKKYLFILGLVGTALFTACSTADDLISDKPVETPSDDRGSVTTLFAEESQNSEEPITLGVGESRGYTRAPIGDVGSPTTTTSFSTEAGKYLGVFCLATGYQSSYESDPPIANYWSANDETGLIVRMKNVPAKVEKVGTISNVKFWDIENNEEKHYFYPMSDWMIYNFYAYYPRQGNEESTLSIVSSRVLEKYFEIDGSQDIIWGMADPTEATAVSPAATDAAPYSAKYFRLKRKEVGANNIANYYPKLKFQHKLVQFRFFVKAAKIDPADPDDHTTRDHLAAINARVTNMYIDNAIYKLSLVVANKSTPANNGVLSMLGAFTTKNLGIKAKGTDDDRFPATPFPADGDDEGNAPDWVDAVNVNAVDAQGNPTDPGFVGYILLARPEVSNVADFKYQLAVKLEYNGGNRLVNLDLELPNGGEFEEGKIYNIIVNVQSPEEIFATAVLNTWDTYKDDGDNPYIQYDVNCSD